MDFHEELKHYQEKINKEISFLLDNKINKTEDDFLQMCYEYLKEFMLRGGKRLRPIMCIKAYETVHGKVDEQILKAAISLEFLHSSTLIHDDIMDEDDLRRNKPSVHKLFEHYFNENFENKKNDGLIFNELSKRFSTSMAIIWGNILFSIGQELLAEPGFDDKLIKKCSAVYNKALRLVNEGQSLDIVMELKKDIKEEEYLLMSKLKTAELFKASVKIGMILAEANKEEIDRFVSFAESVALAFQIKDDLLDISLDSKKGNTFGSDIRKKKRTLMLIHALNSKNKEDLNIIFNKKNIDVKKIIEIYRQAGSIEHAEKMADRLIEKGKKKIDTKFFLELADYLIKRKK